MSTSNVRIGPEQHELIKEMSIRENKSIKDKVEELIDDAYRDFVLRSSVAGYEKLMADPKSARREHEEQAMWELAQEVDADLED